MGTDVAKTQMALGKAKVRVAKAEVRAQAVKGALSEARKQASATKEAQVMEERAFKAVVELVNFKTGGEYHQMVLDSCKKTLQQGFDLCKKWVAK